MEGAGEATSTFDHFHFSQVGGIDADADGDGHDDDSFWSKQHTCSVTFFGGKVGEDRRIQKFEKFLEFITGF